MRRHAATILALLVLGYLLSGCLGSFDDSDQMISVDKTVDQATVNRITGHLLAKVPSIRTEKTQLAAGGKKVKLTCSILSAPEPGYTKNDPDYPYHAYYYWIYVNYTTQDGLLKYHTYLVHKDLQDIYFADPEKDNFVKVG